MVTLRPAARQGHAQRLEEQGHAQLSPYAVEMCKLLGFEEGKAIVEQLMEPENWLFAHVATYMITRRQRRFRALCR